MPTNPNLINVNLHVPEVKPRDVNYRRVLLQALQTKAEQFVAPVLNAIEGKNYFHLVSSKLQTNTLDSDLGDFRMGFTFTVPYDLTEIAVSDVNYKRQTDPVDVYKKPTTGELTLQVFNSTLGLSLQVSVAVSLTALDTPGYKLPPVSVIAFDQALGSLWFQTVLGNIQAIDVNGLVSDAYRFETSEQARSV